MFWTPWLCVSHFTLQETFVLQQDPHDLPMVLKQNALRKKSTVFRSAKQEKPEDYSLQINGRWEFIYGKYPLCQFKVSLKITTSSRLHSYIFFKIHMKASHFQTPGCVSFYILSYRFAHFFKYIYTPFCCNVKFAKLFRGLDLNSSQYFTALKELLIQKLLVPAKMSHTFLQAFKTSTTLRMM